MSGDISILLHMHFCCIQGQLYLYFLLQAQDLAVYSDRPKPLPKFLRSSICFRILCDAKNRQSLVALLRNVNLRPMLTLEFS